MEERNRTMSNEPLNFDFKVCDICHRAMTAKKYWDHDCQTIMRGAAIMPETDDDKFLRLVGELDELRRDLDDNLGEQEELRSIERSITERIEELENELDNHEEGTNE